MDGTSRGPKRGDFMSSPKPAFVLLDEAVARFGKRPAMDFMGKRFSYARIGRLATKAAAGLQGLGVDKGVNVGLCLPNCPQYVVFYYAILKAGGTVVNFNPLYTEREIEEQARATNVPVMVSMNLKMIHDKIGRLAERGVFRQVVVCEFASVLPLGKSVLFRLFKRAEISKVPARSPYVRFRELISGTPPLATPQIDPERDIAVLQFTGGTTGTPKAAMLSHANITVNVQQTLAAFPKLESGRERILAVLPLFHVFAMTAVMNLAIIYGEEMLLLPRMDIKALMALLVRRRPTILPGVPTLFTAICNAAEASGVKDFGFLKFCVSGGAPLSPEIQDRFQRITGRTVIEGYGLSEASPVVAFNDPEHVVRGSVGRALPETVIEIRDLVNPEMMAPAGEQGEICVRGPQVMLGYYKKPEETAAVMVQGALRTGDVGYLDEDGRLFIMDRIKDLIICGGFNVYPRVIEEAAYLHPAVTEAMAIGVPDAYRGQAPKLFVTCKPGAAATGEEILAFLQGHLNKIEMPKMVEIRERLPKTLVGKLSKKDLIQEDTTKV